MTDFKIEILTADQQEKFRTVHQQLQNDYTSYLDYKLNKLNLPDPTENYLSQNDYLNEEENEWKFMIHRYLRARKWNVTHTLKSIRDTIQWRQENNVDRILLDTPQEDIDLSKQYAPYANHGFTRQHSPIYIEKTGRVKLNKCLERFPLDQLVKGHIYLQEFNCRRARQKSRECGQHVETIVTIMDFDGLELMTGRRALPLLKQILNIDNNHYPERMGQAFLLNTPRFFPVLWNMCKSFVDPVTASKVFVLKKNEEASILLQHIDSNQLPQEYQGTCQSCPTAPNCVPVYELP
ncbi:unnamed protein product [Adineta steineri]|uniref:CRAL-TRIO domain-containing protein n=1 Tax=Adineta steineri TaxID=433720 RepID=A0A815RK41_9BILA|nr:unnamed protein product [Adineta steineri]CAF1637538.1 unnamed protein product [Adineta steineri]